MLVMQSRIATAKKSFAVNIRTALTQCPSRSGCKIQLSRKGILKHTPLAAESNANPVFNAFKTVSTSNEAVIRL